MVDLAGAASYFFSCGCTVVSFEVERMFDLLSDVLCCVVNVRLRVEELDFGASLLFALFDDWFLSRLFWL